MRTRPVPTMRTLRIAAGLAVLGALVPVAPPLALFWWAGLVGLGLLVVIDLSVRPGPEVLDVSRDVAAPCHVGRSGTLRLRLRNLGRAPLSVVVRSVLPPALEGADLIERVSLAPGAEIELAMAFVAVRRGEHALPPIGIGLAWGLSLLEHRESRPLPATVAVAPGRPAGEVALLLARAAVLDDHGAHPTRTLQADWEFESLRDYVVGDEPRRLDWKASARRHRPMVRDFQQERDAEVVLAIDCGRLMGTLIDGVTKLDLALTPLLDLAAIALRREDRVGLLAFDARVRAYLPPRPGLTQLHRMTDALARVADSDLPSSHVDAVIHLESRHRRRALLVMFTDFTDELSARELYASLGALSRRHEVIFVAVGDPHLAAVFDTPVDDVRGLFERSVAARLLLERQRTLERVGRLGIRTLDEEPRRLSGPLIARYLELRR